MIITRLSGGIGNQLFQYAIGRALALKNNDELKLDTHVFEMGIEKGRSYKLDVFSIPASHATSMDFQVIGIPNPTRQELPFRLLRVAYRALESVYPLHKRKMIVEPSFHFCPDVLRIDGSCYLSGVWQSEKYFKQAEGVLRKELVFAEAPSPEAAQWVHTAQSCNSVSLHIRRGDYVSNQRANQLHGVCSLDYYKKAVGIILAQIPSPRFFVFSDDIDWAKRNLLLQYPTHFVSGSTIRDTEEMMVMSTCKNHIIANSSFSWWGAWLSENKSKIVIAPKEWFQTADLDTNDLLPDTWIKI